MVKDGAFETLPAVKLATVAVVTTGTSVVLVYARVVRSVYVMFIINSFLQYVMRFNYTLLPLLHCRKDRSEHNPDFSNCLFWTLLFCLHVAITFAFQIFPLSTQSYESTCRDYFALRA